MSFDIVGSYMNKTITQKSPHICGSITIEVDDIKKLMENDWKYFELLLFRFE